MFVIFQAKCVFNSCIQNDHTKPLFYPLPLTLYTMSKATTTKVDVFISGAGPVGLFFAYQMAMRGHSIFICDYKSGPTLESRAASLTARSMELFEARGLAGDFIAESFAAKGIRVWRNGKLVSPVLLK